MESLESELLNVKTALTETNGKLEKHGETFKEMKCEANENLKMCDRKKVNNVYFIYLVCLTKEENKNVRIKLDGSIIEKRKKKHE